MPLTGTPLPNSIYISLNARAQKGTFHYGILTTDANCHGLLLHATTNSGAWAIEERRAKPESSLTLVVLFYIGTADQAAARQILWSIPADGKPSARNGEAFSCRTWVQDALMALHNGRTLVLPADIDYLIGKAHEWGMKCIRYTEAGMGGTVVQDPLAP